ncbi:MAG: transporter substrate-binding domain-containing protein [Alphaproteobacteria bacterium]|nr:MAG: transporter substrate-binding domain-containing protein [Alphaproteobacteria bacterium]
MKFTLTAFAFAAALFFPPKAALAAPVSICTEPEFWAPYNFVADGTLEGLHVELVRAAFADAGEEAPDFHVLPWKRCLERAADGQIDAVLGATWSPERMQQYYFPADAGQLDHPSRFRISQIEYVVVIRSDTQAPAVVNAKNLPEPVGVPFGYMMARMLAKAGKQVTAANKHGDLLRMLNHGRVDSVIILRDMAEMYLGHDKAYANLRELEPALWSTSHHILFSRAGGVDEDRAGRLWAAIEKVREDKARMEALRQAVQKKVKACLDGDVICKF